MSRFSRGLRLAAALLSVVLAASGTGPAAATLEVDGGGGTPYQTIQAAINAAVAGLDDVLVHCGVYQENLVMRSGVSVRGENTSCTVIDGGQNGSVITMNGVDSSTVLEGFTITNGQSGRGGGIYIEDSSPVITGNLIIGNSAVASGALTGYGGGIHVTSPVTLQASTAPVVTRNIIRGNSADRFGGGIEIYSAEGMTIANNLIEENTAVEGGGGIDIFDSFPLIVNNAIVRNCLQGTGTACAQGGGGVALALSGVVQVVNNVIAWNEAAVGGGGYDSVTSTSSFTSNDVLQNLPLDFLGVTDPTGSNGNISVDPLFVTQDSTTKSYQPRSDSPLVDAGSAGLAPSDDLRGIVRPLDGDADGTGPPDIGPRENEGVTRVIFDSGTLLNWDPSIDLAALFNLYRGDMQVLRSSGVYVQDPITVLAARQWCDLVSPSVVDTDSPDPGQTLFYLAVLNNTVEGVLGFDSVGVLRPFTDPNRCP